MLKFYRVKRKCGYIILKKVGCMLILLDLDLSIISGNVPMKVVKLSVNKTWKSVARCFVFIFILLESLKWKMENYFCAMKEFWNGDIFLMYCVRYMIVCTGNHAVSNLYTCIFYFNSGRAVQLFAVVMEDCTLLIASHFILSFKFDFSIYVWLSYLRKPHQGSHFEFDIRIEFQLSMMDDTEMYVIYLYIL